MDEPKPKFATIKDPDLSKFVDKDILDAFDGANVFYHDIINTQLIRSIEKLTKKLDEKDKLKDLINKIDDAAWDITHDNPLYAVRQILGERETEDDY